MPPTWPVEDVNGVQPAALSLSATISQYFIFLFFNIGPSNTALANVTPPTVPASAFALNLLIIHLLGAAPRRLNRHRSDRWT
jgi:hypothetical protein